MKKTIYQVTLFALFLLSLPDGLSAQWWNAYGSGSLEETIETVNGDLVAGGFFRNTDNGNRSGLVIRTDAAGTELWRLVLENTSTFNTVSNIVETANGDLLIGSNQSIDSETLITLYRVSGDGDIIWEKSIAQSQNIRIGDLLERPGTEDIILGIGGGYKGGNNLDSLLAKIILLDQSGEINFEKEYRQPCLPLSNNFSPVLLPISDGFILALGEQIYKLDNSFSEIWSRPGVGYEPIDLIVTTTGDFVCTSIEGYDIGATDAIVFKFDGDGNIEWDTSFVFRPRAFFRVVEKPNQELMILYGLWIPDVPPFLSLTNTVKYRIINTMGVLGEPESLPANLDHSLDVTKTVDGDIVFMGNNNVFPSSISSGFLLRTACDLSDFNNQLTGRVYVDENFNCSYDSTEQLLTNHPVQFIHGSGLSFFSMSDANGEYEVAVTSGSYQFSAMPQSPYEIPCTPQIATFYVSDTTILSDLPMQRVIECPQMTVSMGAIFIRRCFENTHFVQYCNTGTADAEAAYVEIQLDSFHIYESSSLPLSSQNGLLLTFDLGDVAIGFCDQFTIRTTLSCEAELGQNHCLSAHIYPDSICLTPSSEWDGSSIQVSAQCVEDSVRFFINNIGTGDMASPLDYIVIQDEILFRQDNFQLNSGSSFQVAVPADGSTYRIEAEQAAGHPGNSMPSATVEGCGEWPFETGFFGFFPQDDNDLFIDTDCQLNIGAYDPNDKTAFPEGYGELHLIERNSFIEYKIRFQNTGTDTAFNVTIRDELSEMLNIATLQMGVASHPYTWRLQDQGTIVMDFPDIQLPDSTTNLAGSNGFVTFKIKVKPWIPIYEYRVIRNRAAIYFDFNEPVITNWVFHKLDTNFIEIISATEPIDFINNRIKIAPNPARNITTMTFPEDSNFPLTLKLYSAEGVLVRTKIVNELTMELEVSKLTAGIYYYGVYDERGLWTSGKVVVQ